MELKVIKETYEWDKPPLTFAEWCKIGGIKITDYKMSVFEKCMPLTANAVFDDKEFNRVVLMWGKGSGKDFSMGWLYPYFMYTLSAARFPAKYLNFESSAPIHLLFIGDNLIQLSAVFLSYMNSVMTATSEWLHGWVNLDGAWKMEKGGTFMVLPTHSLAKSWDGVNPLFYLMDETSNYPGTRAETVFRTVDRSAITRFPKKYLGTCISYPRSPSKELDWTLRTHDKIVKGAMKGFTDRAPTWVCRGVPKSTYAREFEEDYYAAMLHLACEPIIPDDAFFEHPENISWGHPLLTLIPPKEDEEEDVPRVEWHTEEKFNPIVVGIDAGTSRSNFVISVMGQRDNGQWRQLAIYAIPPPVLMKRWMPIVREWMSLINPTEVISDNYYSEWLRAEIPQYKMSTCGRNFYTETVPLFRQKVYDNEIVLCDTYKMDFLALQKSKINTRNKLKDILDSSVQSSLWCINQQTAQFRAYYS